MPPLGGVRCTFMHWISQSHSLYLSGPVFCCCVQWLHLAGVTIQDTTRPHQQLWRQLQDLWDGLLQKPWKERDGQRLTEVQRSKAPYRYRRLKTVWTRFGPDYLLHCTLLRVICYHRGFPHPKGSENKLQETTSKTHWEQHYWVNIAFSSISSKFSSSCALLEHKTLGYQVLVMLHTATNGKPQTHCNQCSLCLRHDVQHATLRAPPPIDFSATSSCHKFASGSISLLFGEGISLGFSIDLTECKIMK